MILDPSLPNSLSKVFAWDDELDVLGLGALFSPYFRGVDTSDGNGLGSVVELYS